MALLEDQVTPLVTPGVDEAAARRSLRDQIAKLEFELVTAATSVYKMLLDPGHYRYVRVHNSDIGEPGCKNWHVKPRLGIIGMLAGWWHVKISSGCPLAWGPWRTPRPLTD